MAGAWPGLLNNAAGVLYSSTPYMMSCGFSQLQSHHGFVSVCMGRWTQQLQRPTTHRHRPGAQGPCTHACIWSMYTSAEGAPVQWWPHLLLCACNATQPTHDHDFSCMFMGTCIGVCTHSNVTDSTWASCHREVRTDLVYFFFRSNSSVALQSAVGPQVGPGPPVSDTKLLPITAEEPRRTFA